MRKNAEASHGIKLVTAAAVMAIAMVVDLRDFPMGIATPRSWTKREVL
jgi:hypothetical protein